MKHVEIYTDGACSGNPGPGGWGAILRFRSAAGKVFEKEISGGEASTTNNRMELTGLLEALRQLKEPCDIDLYSDSQYVINGLEKGWAKSWRARGWKKADKSPALNPDLWAPLLEESEKHKIHYHWLKGHAGHPENERCDRLAVEQSKKYHPPARATPGGVWAVFSFGRARVEKVPPLCYHASAPPPRRGWAR